MQTQQLSLTHLVRSPQPPVEHPPLLVLLHGYGSNERDLFGLASYVDPRFLVVSVRAPQLVMQGAFGWFQINWTNTGISIDRTAAEQARDQIIQFVEEAAAAYGADPERIYLLGFSQGAIMSAAVALARPNLVAGAVLMSGSVTDDVVPDTLDRRALEGKPFLVVHGLYDQVLPIRNGRVSRDTLSMLPVALSYHEYPIGHEVSQESLSEVVRWLRARLDESDR